jgi:DNA-binding NtrC family response regulator
MQLPAAPKEFTRDCQQKKRNRISDIINGQQGLKMSPGAEEALCAYDWPGNVRELERVIERAVALVESDRIELDDLPPRVRGQFAEVLWPSLVDGDSLRTWGSRYVRLVFERCGRNKRTACRVLNISYHTLTAYLRHTDGRPSATTPAQLPAWVRSMSDRSGAGEVLD